MFEPRKKRRRTAGPSQPVPAADYPSPAKRQRVTGTLSLDGFWAAIDAPSSKPPGGQDRQSDHPRYAPSTPSTAAPPPRPPLPRAGED